MKKALSILSNLKPGTRLFILFIALALVSSLMTATAFMQGKIGLGRSQQTAHKRVRRQIQEPVQQGSEPVPMRIDDSYRAPAPPDTSGKVAEDTIISDEQADTTVKSNEGGLLVPPAMSAIATAPTIAGDNTGDPDIGPKVVNNTTYPASVASSVALDDMSTGTTSLVGSASDDGVSTVQNIGFDLWFDGVRYTQFSANANGLVRLGSTVISGAFSNSLAGAVDYPLIAPYWDDLATGTNGSVVYKVTGTAPNRKLTVQWFVTVPRATASAANATFQAWIFETTGKIQFVYGSGMVANSTNSGYSVGIASSTTSFSSITTSSNTVSSVTANNTNTTAITSGTSYIFTPNVPIAPTNLTFTNVGAGQMTLNWTDNATNEVGYAIYDSTDNVNFTFIGQLGANSTGAIVSGLSASTTYFWKVYAVTEGAQSSALSGSQATNAAISGTKTIGPGGNYTTFTAAINDANAGPAGSVTFNVTAGTTFTENTPCITGGDLTHQVVFQKSGAGANPIIQPTGSTGTADYGVCILGGDYITFDGIDVAVPSGNTAVEYGYTIQNASATNGANNNTIKNTSIIMNRASTNISYGILQFAGVAPTSAAGTNNSNKYYNLSIQNVGEGILLQGSTAFQDTANEVGTTGGGTTTIGGAAANDIGNFAGTVFGIQALNQSGVKISNTEIRNITDLSTSSSVYGIYLANTNANTYTVGTNEISNNKIHDIALTGASTTGIVYGIREELTVNAGSVSNVFNNFVYNLNTSSVATTTRKIIGIGSQIGGSGAGSIHNVDANSVRIAPTSVSASNTCFENGTSTPVFKIRDNIFANFTGAQTTAKHYAIVITANALGAAGSVSNFNDFYVANTTNGFVGLSSGTDRVDLAAWRTATSQDASSISADPQFTSATDLHINTAVSSPVSNAGTPIATVTTDIDGDTRSGSTPDIGADEFTATPTIIVTGGPLTFPNTAVGAISAELTYTVSGSNLTADIIVTSPSTDFQVSKTTGTGFGSSVTFTQSGGTVATQTVFVRFTPQSAGAKSGNITNASTGATTQNVAVSGTGVIAMFRSIATGNWNSTSTWEMSIDNGANWTPATITPTSAGADTITVRSPNTVTVTANVDADQMTINSGGTVSVNGGVTFTIADGTGTDLTDNGTLATAGTVTDNGQAVINNTLQINEGGFPGGGTGTYSYDQTNGVLVFNNSTGPYGVNNNNYWPTTSGPQNVTVQNTGGIQMNVARTVNLLFQYAAGVSGANNLTLNGTSQVNNGGFTSGSPNYGNASLLRYNTGGTYGRNGEWLPGATSNPGYPHDVQLSNNTSLNLANGSNLSPFQMGGSLTIDAGSTLDMVAGGSTSQPLTVVGSVTNNGTLTLSTTIGGDLKLGGNWSNNGTFNNNNRTVTFNGTQNQSIGGANSTTFAFLSISNTGTSPNNIVTLAKDTIVTQALNITQGVFDQGTGAGSSNLTTNAVTVSSGATFQNLGTGDLTLSGNVSNSGTINFNANGTPCGQTDDILIRSSASGTQRAWSGTGTFSMTDVDVKDQGGTAVITVTSGTDSGNNGVNWVFVANCPSVTYTWGGPTSGTADWNVPTNWTPTRTAPLSNDILVIDGTVTTAPTIINVPTQTIAALRVTNNAAPKLSTNAANTLTISGATGTDLTIPSGSSLTLQGASPLTINIASGSIGTVGGLLLLQDGPHRLVANAASAVTFQSGAFGTTQTGETANPFGTGAASDGAADSIVFQSGAHYFHNAGLSPFGAAGNPSIVVFQTGSDANWLTNTGFQASGRTYSILNLGKTGPGAVTVNVSDAGTGNFQFDNLNVISNSSLTYNGSGASSVIIQGDITSDGSGAPANDVSLTAGTGNIILNKAGTQTFSATGAAKTITFGSNATVNSGTTLALTNRVVNVTSGTLSVLGSLSRTTGYIIGNLLKPLAAGTNSFEVGTANGYSPVGLNVTSGAGNNFTARAVQGPQPNIQTPTKALQRYWTLTATGVTADVTFNYLDPPDVPATATESNFILFKYEPGSSPSGFTTPGTTANTTNTTYDFVNNKATITGVSSFSDWTLAEAIAPTAVKLKDFKADANDKGEVMIQWQSGYEVNNLGYNLYRQVAKPRKLGVYKPDVAQRERITPSLVAGSALLTAGRSVLTAGQSYTWFDKVAIGSRVQYWLEDVDVNGTRTMHGPIYAGSGAFTHSMSRQALLLNQLKPNNNAGAIQLQGAPASTATSSRVSLRNPGDANAPSPTMQQNIAAMPAVKLSVSQDGWYRVSQPELAAAGLDLSPDASLLKLYANGREVPIELSGDQHQLTSTDTVEFYGRALNSPTDAAQTYYLLVGSSAGKRITRSQAGADPDATSAAGSFDYTLQRTEKLTYFPGLDNKDADSFFGQIITASPVSETLAIGHPSGAALAGQGAQLEVRLQGVTATAHHVRVLFNGTDVGTLDFANTENPAQSLALSGALLREGDNTVQLVALGGDSDVSLVDTLRLTYAHTYAADGDLLAVNAGSSEGPLSVNGFTSAAIRVVDTMDAKNTQELIPTVQAQPDGTYTATIQPAPLPSGSQHSLHFFTDSRTIHPDAVTRNEPSTWGRGGDGADFVIITHADFKQSVEPLAALRRSQGMTVNVIDVEDIYDEFSYGAHSPQAVRDLLSAAMSKWETKPGYVLLVGDATYDPKNYLGQGANDLVPTKLLWAASMKTASDDWMADLDGDGIPELAVGRLPVRTASEADTMIGKIVNYVAGQAGQGAVLVADRNGGDDFEGASSSVRQQLPAGMPVEVINRGTQDTNTVRSQIIGDLNQGPMVVNYFGHGSVGLWTGAGLLTATDATALSNGNRLPLFTMMTCLNGYFHDLSGDSMAEALLKAQGGGAVAVWASSGQTEMNGQLEMAGPLYQLLFGGQPVRLGDAIRGAKSATSDQSVRRSWIFFGDPTMRLR